MQATQNYWISIAVNIDDDQKERSLCILSQDSVFIFALIMQVSKKQENVASLRSRKEDGAKRRGVF